MANRTVKDAKSVHGTNPQYLVEKIIRTRIYESRYWKEECFALSAELVVDKGAELRYIGGIYGGNIKPTPFLCLTLKMLQIQPDKDIIIQFISQLDFKYIRALGAFYLRLTSPSLECWKYLEPLYDDYRKLRVMDRMGNFHVMHMDEFIDSLLRDDRVFDVILPRISKRRVHEEAGELEPRVSALEDDLENVEESDEEEKAQQQPEVKKDESDRKREKKKKRDKRSRSREKERDRDKDKDRERDRERDRDRDRYDDRHRDRDRDYDRRDRDHDRHRDDYRHRDDDRSSDRRRHRSPSPDRRRRSRSRERRRSRDRSYTPERRRH